MMEYSPMMLVMLWALTPSSEGAGAVPATVEELVPPAMTVHQESYFTFNHGKPFLAEQDPETGAILNLKTTPVHQEDYLYEEEEEEPDGIDRKDGPKVFTRNDIASPSKDPDLHKFLNLPVHYSSADKFPLISSSYANTKVQGHNAASYSNHRPAPSSSTVSPSYYPLKTSPTTTVPTSTSTTTLTTTTSTTTTTTTTTRPPTMRTTTTLKPPPPAYEYEYEYDYDREPVTDKKSTTQTILDFFDKDYAFLGTSEEEKNTSKIEYVLPSAFENKNKEDEHMISSNSNLFIPPDYLKPTNETRTEGPEVENNTTVKANTPETNVSTTETPPSSPPKVVITEISQTEMPNLNNIKFEDDTKYLSASTKLIIETTTTKIEETTKPPIKEHKVPFFPTVIPEDQENTMPTKSMNESNTDNVIQSKPTQNLPQETKPTQNTPPEVKPTQNSPQETKTDSTYATPVKPLQFHHPYLKPQDIYALQNRPLETVRPPPYPNQYQRPYAASNVPPEMQPPQKPVEQNYYPRPERPVADTFTSNSHIDSVHYNPTHNKRPIETLANKQPLPHYDHYRPQYESRPQDSQSPKLENPPHIQNKPMEIKPQENKQRPEPNTPAARPVFIGTPSRPTESAYVPHTRPYEGVLQKPEQHLRPVEMGLQNRPQEMPQMQTPQRPISRPSDARYPPPYGTLRPQEFKPDQKPLTPEYRPLPPRPEETRPTGIQEYNAPLGTKVQDINKNRPETPTLNSNNYQVQFTQPSKVENHFIKVSPGQENPSYSLQTSFSIGVPPPDEVQGSPTSSNVGQIINQGLSKPGQGVGQVLFPDEDDKKTQAARPWGFEEKRPTSTVTEGDKYPRPPWESHLKPPLVFNHLKKEPYPFKRPKPTRPDLPNILPQFRPNAKIGHADPHVYLKAPYETLRPPPLPRPQFLRAEPPVLEEEKPVHRRNGLTTRVVPAPIQPIIQTSKRGALRSEDEKTDPVFVVYPSNNGQDGVVVGTRGPQRPLPPDNLDIEDSFPLDTNKNFQSRVDTPILKGKPTSKPVIKNDFPYPLVKPSETPDEKTTPLEKVTKEYTAFSPTVSPTEKEHDTEINVIPYLQDYMPFATKKPIQDPPKWNVGDDIKPISVTLKTQKIEETTSKIENHKTGDLPTPQDFQAPFHASLSAPSQGWSVVRPRPEPEKEDETTTIKVIDESETKFDIQNFKPQLFGGFQPIIPPIGEMDDKKEIKNEKETR